MQLLLGEGILDRAHVLDFNPQPVPTGASLEAKIAIVLELEIAPDRVRECNQMPRPTVSPPC